VRWIRSTFLRKQTKKIEQTHTHTHTHRP